MLPETVSGVAVEKRREPPVTFGPFTFDPNSGLLRREHQAVAVPPRVLAVLELLLTRAGDLVPRQELIDTVWKDAFVTDTSLAEAVSFLRQTLGDDPQAPTYIQTVHRRGYRFIARVSPVAATSPASTERDESSAMRGRISPSIGGQLVPWSIAALSAAAAIAAVWLVARRPDVTPRVVRFELASLAGTRFDERGPALALSADGSRAAWAACDSACRLYVRPLEGLDAVALSGTEGAAAPFFSPDGRWLGYFADGKLRKVAAAGGAPVLLADAADAFGGVWTPDGEIVFGGAAAGLTIVGDDGRNLRRLTTPIAGDGELRHAWPSISADGSALLFTILTSPAGETAGRIGAMRFARGTERASWKSILDGSGRAQAFSNDTILFSRGAELAAIAFDPSRLAVSGTPHAVVTGIATDQFAVSAAGALAYVPAARALAADKQTFASAALSPDGSRVAAAVPDGARSDIWVASASTGAATRLTHEGANVAPVWDPNGGAVFFSKRTDGPYEVWKRDADASTAATRVFGAAGHAAPLSVSADGQRLLVSRSEPETGLDIWSVPVAGGSAHALVRTPFDETAASTSRDGRFVAYQSNESGRWQIYVMRLEDGRRTVVSTDGGVAPSWDDGNRVRYQAGAKTMVASIDSAPDLRASAPVEAAIGRRALPVAVDASGRVRFAGAAPPLQRAVVTLSFDRELRELLGPRPGAMPR